MWNFLTRFFAASRGEEAVASRRLDDYAGSWQQYNPSDLVAKHGVGVFSKMRRDDQVKAAMSFKKNAVIAPGWAIKSPEGESDDWEVRAFVEWCLNNVEGTFDSDLLEIMSALDYGFSVSEKLFEKVSEGEWSGKVKLAEIKGKSPETIEFKADKFGNLEQLLQVKGFQREPLTIAKFIVWSYQMEFGNWYGESDLEAAYPAWWTKTNAYKWLAIGLEKSAIPPLVALYNSGAYQGGLLEKLKTFLSGLQSNSVGMLPRPQKDDMELWSPSTGTQVKDLFPPVLSMLNQDIARALLVPSLIGATADSQTGSYSRSQVHFDLFEMQVDRIRCELVERVVNEQIIKQLVDINFSNVKEYPYFEFLPLTADRRTEILATWKDLLNAGAVHSQVDDEKHIRELLEFPELDEDALEEEQPEPEPILPDPEESPTAPDGAKTEEPPTPGGSQQPAESGRAFSFTPSREKTRFEKKVDFKAVVKTLDTHEEDIKERLRSAIRSTQDQVIKKIGASFDKDPYGILERLKLGNSALLRRTVEDLIDGAFNDGRRSIAPGKFRDALPGVESKEALRWLKAQKLWVSGVLSDRLLSDIKKALLEAMRAGDTTQDAVERVKAVMLPYIGNDNVTSDKTKLPLSARLIETIVRTNTTQAYNMGRLVEVRKNPLLAGVQYSAIIDERTTDVCQALDGKIFKPGDSDLDALTPPNHHNCRSLLVPVMIDEQPSEGDFISPSEVGRAREKAGKGFV